MDNKNIEIPRPKDWQRFERLCADLFAQIWKYPHTQMHGRHGQSQAGVDVYGESDEGWIGVQCKGRNGDYDSRVSITERDIFDEVKKAKKFKPKLSCFIIATTASNSESIQSIARSITEKHKSEGLFSVHVYGWDELSRRLGDHHRIAEAHGLLPRTSSDEILLSPDGDILNCSDDALANGLAGYRNAILKSADIFDLGELGGLDPEIVKERLALRQLYIPLRCFVAPPKADSRAVFERFLGLRGEENESDQVAESLGRRVTDFFRLIALADPGSGKTTFIKWITTALLLRECEPDAVKDIPDADLLPEFNYLPVLISCRALEISDEVKSFRSFIFKSLDVLEIPPGVVAPAYCAIWSKICSGDAILLIDGIDEISDAVKRQAFVDQIEIFSNSFRNIPIVVTSRIYGYAELGKGIGADFDHVMVAPLDEKEQDLFCENWAKITETSDKAPEFSSRLKNSIKSSHTIKKMASNPLLLTTLALVVRKHGSIPERRSKLYAEAFDLLLRWRARSDVRLDPKESERRLSYLAYNMTEQDKKRMKGDEIIGLLDAMADELPRYRRLLSSQIAADYINILERRSAIIVNVGREYSDGDMHSVFEFRHLCFQDYLAGRAIGLGCYPGGKENDVARKIRELTKTACSSVGHRWREPIRLAIAALDDMGAPTQENISAVLYNKSNGRGTTVDRGELCIEIFQDEPSVSDEFAEDCFRDIARVCIDKLRLPDFILIYSPNRIIPESMEGVRALTRSSWGEIARKIFLEEMGKAAAKLKLQHVSLLCDLIWGGFDFKNEGLVFEKYKSLGRDIKNPHDIIFVSTFIRCADGYGYELGGDFRILIKEEIRSGYFYALSYVVSLSENSILSRDEVFSLLEMEDRNEFGIIIELINLGPATIDIIIEYFREDDERKWVIFTSIFLKTVFLEGFPGKFKDYVVCTDAFIEDFIKKPFNKENMLSFLKQRSITDDEGELILHIDKLFAEYKLDI